MSEIEIAIIGGSGLYDMTDLADVEHQKVKTPFGDPSDTITIGSLHGNRVAFLPRHGRGHFLTPSEVPYRANIFALKDLGVKFIISVSACGSLREDYGPGHVVIPDQLVDFTKGNRESTFFGRGLVAHVGVPDPFSPELSEVLAKAVVDASGIIHQGGTFVTIEGPRFSTRAESNLFRQWGMSIIGMTTSPEAYLAAEAEIAYACMAHVTDYDVWHQTEEPVSVELVIRTLSKNTSLAKRAISLLVRRKQQWEGEFSAHQAMQGALGLVGDWDMIPSSVKEELAPLIHNYMSG
jgi:5'-methylthioadenosine phosphorylase